MHKYECVWNVILVLCFHFNLFVVFLSVTLHMNKNFIRIVYFTWIHVQVIVFVISLARTKKWIISWRSAHSIFMELKKYDFCFYTLLFSFTLIKFVWREHANKNRRNISKHCFAFLRIIFLTVDSSWRSCAKRASFAPIWLSKKWQQ